MKIIVTMICSVLTAILAMYIGMQIQKNNMEFELKKQESAYQEKIQEAQKLAEEKNTATKVIPSNFKVDANKRTIPTYKRCQTSEISNNCSAGDLITFTPNRWGNDQLPIFAAATFCDFNLSIVYNNGGVTCIKRDVDVAYHLDETGHYTPEGMRLLTDVIYNINSALYNYNDISLLETTIANVYTKDRLIIKLKISDDSDIWDENSEFTFKKFKNLTPEQFCNTLKLNPIEKEILAHSYGYTYEFYASDNEKITKIINNEGKETQKEDNSENNTNTKNSKGDKLVLSFDIDPGMCK